MNVKIEELKDEITSIPVYIEPPESGWGIIFPKKKTVRDAAAALMDLIEGAVGFVSIDLTKERGETVYGVLIDFSKEEEKEN